MASDKTIIIQLRDGDIQAFESLYSHWSGRIYNFVLKISHNDTYLAEEIVQTVFIKVWERREDIDPEQSFSSYLFTIAKNQLARIYQQQMYEFLYREHAHQVDGDSENTTENEVEYRLLDQYLDVLIGQLPEARRRVFIMSRKKYMTNKEIANELNIAEHTVESQLSKANTFIRSKLKEHYDLSIALLLSILIS